MLIDQIAAEEYNPQKSIQRVRAFRKLVSEYNVKKDAEKERLEYKPKRVDTPKHCYPMTKDFFAYRRASGRWMDGKPYRIRSIILDVCRKHGVDPNDVMTASRMRPIVNCRNEIAWEIRNICAADGNPIFSFPQIGKYLGGRDHTTIIHAIRRHEAGIK